MLGTLDVADFSHDAAAAAIWTRGVLGEPARGRFSRTLEPSGEREDVDLFHASPRDPVWEYVLTGEAARGRDPRLRASRSRSSATATSRSRSPDDRGPTGGHAPGGTEIELDGARWLLNPGSVGQPRDGDPHAAWLLLDLDARRASFRRVALRHRADAGRDPRAGLPDALAERLAHGV